MNNDINIVLKLRPLVTELQKERGRSVGYTASVPIILVNNKENQLIQYLMNYRRLFQAEN